MLKGIVANGIFRNIGRNAGAFLVPAYPDDNGGISFINWDQRFENSNVLLDRSDKSMNKMRDVARGKQLGTNIGMKPVEILSRCIDQLHLHGWRDAQFFDRWSTRVA